MTDLIIQAKKNGSLTAQNVSFDKLREIAGRDCGCWEQLGRGRAILDSCDQLDQYLYTHGPMTKSQWDNFLPQVSLPDADLCVTDYGCGQGLGSALLFDHFGSPLISRTKQVKLIEPSAVALNRAEAIIHCYGNDLDVVAVNKKIDDLSARDLQADGRLPQVHMLSNILDIDDFNHWQLFSGILSNVGSHILLAVSHDRDFYGGSRRFENLQAELIKPEHKKWLAVNRSVIKKFNCSGDRAAISWDLRVEVVGGSV